MWSINVMWMILSGMSRNYKKDKSGAQAASLQPIYGNISDLRIYVFKFVLFNFV